MHTQQQQQQQQAHQHMHSYSGVFRILKGGKPKCFDEGRGNLHLHF